MSARRIRTLVALVTVLLLFVLLIPLSASRAQTPAANPTMAPSVTVKDQAFVDNRVIIDKVVSEGPGWLVVHNAKGDTFGDDIGEAALSTGENSHVVVAIPDASKVTAKLFAMLHTDKGVVGKYEFPGPDGPVQLNGQLVNPSFMITSGLPGSK